MSEPTEPTEPSDAEVDAAEAAEADAAGDADGEDETGEEGAGAARVGLVGDEGEIDTDAVAELTDDVRDGIANLTQWLGGLAAVLADMEARSAAPPMGALLAASAKVRAHCDDVLRHLSPLSAGVQALANEAAANPE